MKITITQTIEFNGKSITKEASAEMENSQDIHPELTESLWRTLRESKPTKTKGMEDAKDEE